MSSLRPGYRCLIWPRFFATSARVLSTSVCGSYCVLNRLLSGREVEIGLFLSLLSNVLLDFIIVLERFIRRRCEILPFIDLISKSSDKPHLFLHIFRNVDYYLVIRNRLSIFVDACRAGVAAGKRDPICCGSSPWLCIAAG